MLINMLVLCKNIISTIIQQYPWYDYMINWLFPKAIVMGSGDKSSYIVMYVYQEIN